MARRVFLFWGLVGFFSVAARAGEDVLLDRLSSAYLQKEASFPEGRMRLRTFAEPDGKISELSKRFSRRFLSILVSSGTRGVVDPAEVARVEAGIREGKPGYAAFEIERELHRELGVAAVISGTLTDAGEGGLEVSLRVTRAADGTLAWLHSERFEPAKGQPPSAPAAAPAVLTPASLQISTAVVATTTAAVAGEVDLLPLPTFTETEGVKEAPSEPVAAPEPPPEEVEPSPAPAPEPPHEPVPEPEPAKQETVPEKTSKPEKRPPPKKSGPSILDRDRYWTFLTGITAGKLNGVKVQQNGVSEDLGSLETGTGFLLGLRRTRWEGRHRGWQVEGFWTRSKSQAQIKTVGAATGRYFGVAIPAGTSRLSLSDGHLTLSTLGVCGEFLARIHGDGVQWIIGAGPAFFLNRVSSSVLDGSSSEIAFGPKVTLGVRSKVSDRYGFVLEGRFFIQSFTASLNDAAAASSAKADIKNPSFGFGLGLEF